jgi:hypothetical protein
MNDFFTSLIHYITGDELSKTQGRIDSTNYLLKLEKTLDELFEKKLRNVNGVNFSIYKELINVIHRYLKI